MFIPNNIFFSFCFQTYAINTCIVKSAVFSPWVFIIMVKRGFPMLMEINLTFATIYLFNIIYTDYHDYGQTKLFIAISKCILLNLITTLQLMIATSGLTKLCLVRNYRSIHFGTTKYEQT